MFGVALEILVQSEYQGTLGGTFSFNNITFLKFPETLFILTIPFFLRKVGIKQVTFF
jgi:NHS family xanthosine MFS transporter